MSTYIMCVYIYIYIYIYTCTHTHTYSFAVLQFDLMHELLHLSHSASQMYYFDNVSGLHFLAKVKIFQLVYKQNQATPSFILQCL
jgi:uncharacterized membrane protein (DUF106 family)